MKISIIKKGHKHLNFTKEDKYMEYNIWKYVSPHMPLENAN